MKRLVARLALLYVALALLGHAKEQRGSLVCECNEDCWCKRPGLELFRWVFPFGHSLG